jgi:hypothetical protein
MEDINKIRLIHDLKNLFTVDENTIQKLIDQIDNSEFKSNIDRFFRGYSSEDNFHFLFSALPWVKLAHGLRNYLKTLWRHIISMQTKDK